MTFLELTYETLKKAGIPLTTQEIWEYANKFGFIKQLNSNGKTPLKTLEARLYIDIRDNSESNFYQYSKRPSKFYLKNADVSKETLKTVENKKAENPNFHERDLHPLLTSFVYSDRHFKCFAKTIFHEKSKRKTKGANEWLHPDIVGVYFPFSNYSENTRDFIDSINNSRVKLFSFEMKIKVNFSSLREYYFQAVSNSSWANEGYLVALDYDDSAELLEEMLRLNNAFGIGFIKLNPEDIEQSEILVPSKQKDDLDWDTVDRLVDTNSDFNSFIIATKDSINSKRAHAAYFDKILNDKEIRKHIKEHKIY